MSKGLRLLDIYTNECAIICEYRLTKAWIPQNHRLLFPFLSLIKMIASKCSIQRVRNLPVFTASKLFRGAHDKQGKR